MLQNCTTNLLNEVGHYSVLSQQEEKELFQQLRCGNEDARDIIVNSNLKLVVSLVKGYLNKGASFDDLFQEGSYGLLLAVDKFDETKNNKFSTYASIWIKKYILDYLSNNHLISIPSYIRNNYVKVNNAYNNLLNTINNPTSYDVFNALEGAVDLNSISTILDMKKDYVSLDAEVCEGKTYSDYIADPDCDLEENYNKNELYTNIKTAIQDTLDVYELDIFEKRVCDDLSFSEIAKGYNTSKETIRKKYNDIINKLQQNEYIDSIKPYIR